MSIIKSTHSIWAMNEMQGVKKSGIGWYYLLLNLLNLLLFVGISLLPVLL